jgi:hypothetical protein
MIMGSDQRRNTISVKTVWGLSGKTDRERAWTKSIAVGPKSFVVEMQARLGMKTRYRLIRKASAGTFVIEDT